MQTDNRIIIIDIVWTDDTKLPQESNLTQGSHAEHHIPLYSSFNKHRRLASERLDNLRGSHGRELVSASSARQDVTTTLRVYPYDHRPFQTFILLSQSIVLDNNLTDQSYRVHCRKITQRNTIRCCIRIHYNRIRYNGIVCEI